MFPLFKRPREIYYRRNGHFQCDNTLNHQNHYYIERMTRFSHYTVIDVMKTNEAEEDEHEDERHIYKFVDTLSLRYPPSIYFILLFFSQHFVVFLHVIRICTYRSSISSLIRCYIKKNAHARASSALCHTTHNSSGNNNKSRALLRQRD